MSEVYDAVKELDYPIRLVAEQLDNCSHEIDEAAILVTAAYLWLNMKGDGGIVTAVEYALKIRAEIATQLQKGKSS